MVNIRRNIGSGRNGQEVLFMKALGKSIVVFDLIFNLICLIAAGLLWKLIFGAGRGESAENG